MVQIFIDSAMNFFDDAASLAHSGDGGGVF